MKYLNKFENESDYQAFKSSSEYVEPNVSLIENGNTIFYEPVKPTTLISFTVYDTIYQAEEGMTWIEFCESKYNYHPSYGKQYFSYSVYSNPESENTVDFALGSIRVKNVDPYDVIISGKTYEYTKNLTHGGGSN
jgi:hypothetical protein